MSGPRQSLLSLFDPLKSPSVSAPKSPTLRESDKENEGDGQERLTLTAFFNKTYSTHTTEKGPSLWEYSGQLVDIESGNLEDDQWGEKEPQNRENTSAVNQLQERVLRPLANTESPAQSDVTQEHLYKTNTAHSFPNCDLRTAILDSTSANPAQETIAASNQGDLSSSELSTLPTSIVVSRAPQEDASYAPSLDTSTVNLIPSSTTNLLVNASLSSLPPSASTSSAISSSYLAPQGATPKSGTRHISRSKNRNSLDLHTSFNMHLQAESSFDLLNDRISFLNESAPEDDFDIEAEEKAMEAIIAKNERSGPNGPEETEQDTTAEARPVRPASDAAEDLSSSSSQLENLGHRDSDRLPTPSTPQATSKFSVITPENNTAPGLSTSQESTPQPSARGAKRHSVPQCSPGSSKEAGSNSIDENGTPVAPTKPRRLSRADICSPPTRPSFAQAAPAVQPVPALRIVKRAGTGKGHYKTLSADPHSPEGPAHPPARPTAAPAPASRATRRPSVAAPSASTSASGGVISTQPRVVVKGVQRPAPGSKFVLPSTHKPIAPTASMSTQLAGTRSALVPTSRSGMGPARITGVQRPPVLPRAVAESKKPVQQVTSHGESKPKISGLRVPSQSMHKFSGTGTETKLPVPKSMSMSSKLPSFGGRSKIGRLA